MDTIQFISRLSVPSLISPAFCPSSQITRTRDYSHLLTANSELSPKQILTKAKPTVPRQEVKSSKCLLGFLPKSDQNHLMLKECPIGPFRGNTPSHSAEGIRALVQGSDRQWKRNGLD